MNARSGQLIHFSLTAVTACLVAAILLLAAVPPISRDALTHHLYVPKLYLKNGGMTELPQITASYYPMNLDLLYMIPLSFGNDVVPKYIHMAFAFLTSWMIFRYLRRHCDPPWPLLGALFFLSIPVVVKLATTVYVDLGLICFSTAALLGLMRWCETGFRSRYLILSGVVCGLAMGTKYNGLVTWLILTLLVPLLRMRSDADGKPSSRKAVQSALLFAAVALVIFSPWMAKNYWMTRNPVYPLYNSVFNPQTPKLGAHLGTLTLRKLVYGEPWWETLLVPARIFFQGQDDLPQRFDGRLNPLLLIGSLLAFCFPRRLADADLRERKVLAGFATLFILIVFFTRDMRIRYMAPAIPPLVILSIQGIRDAVRWTTTRFAFDRQAAKNGAVSAVLLFLLITNGAYVVDLFKKVTPVAYLRGEVSREVLISRFVPEYPAVVFMNASIPQEAKVLGIFMGNRGYYSDRELFFGNEMFFDLLKGAENADAIAQRLQRQGFSHLLVGHQALQSWAVANLNQQHLRTIQNFFSNDVRLLFSQDAYSLFALRKLDTIRS